MKESKPFNLLGSLAPTLVQAAFEEVLSIPDGSWTSPQVKYLDKGRKLLSLVGTEEWMYADQAEQVGDPHQLITPLKSYTPVFKHLVIEVQRLCGGGRVGFVQLSCLEPLVPVLPHTDHRGVYYDTHHRIRVALNTNGLVQFVCGGSVITPKVGDVWKFDNTLLHGVLTGRYTTTYSITIDIENLTTRSNSYQ